jgi:hypothetical protein
MEMMRVWLIGDGFRFTTKLTDPPLLRGLSNRNNPQTNRLMDAGFLSKPGHLVFDVQLAPFELYNSQIVGRRMGKRFADFLF